MRNNRTVEEEQVRQLKIISYQLCPLAMFGKVGLWAAVFLVGVALAGTLVVGISGGR